ncbi:MAG TPA: hypothetical protein VKQ05_09450 [Gemmatimonadales bacterium]|nr:hypothetical protein [Gemmatimonadales bacterium]
MKTVSRVAALLGALGSIVLVIYAGRRNAHPLLVVLFVLWVAAPFVGYFLAGRLSARWPALASSTLDIVIMLAAIVSLVVYTAAALRPGRAVPFVLVPLIAWVFVLLAVAASVAERGRSPRSDR